MEKIHLEGYSEFIEKYYTDNKKLFSNLAEGQHPHSMIITCSDSRVSVSKILSAKPGDLFVAQNIGNIVPPYKTTQGATEAAIEYAVNALKIKHIVVLGHSSCGACDYLYHKPIEGEDELLQVDQWIELASLAKHASILECHADKSKKRSEVTEKNNIKLSLERLISYPYIVDALEENQIKLHGWWYDIGSGDLEVYNQANKNFEKVLLEKI